VHDHHDELTGVLASSLAKRAPGGARYPRMSKKDLVEAAVEFYLNGRRRGAG
jgi:hypothetical protein